MNCIRCQRKTLQSRWLCVACALNPGGVEIPRLVIGICGRARHGKNVAATAISQAVAVCGYGSIEMTVSDIVFEVARESGLITVPNRCDCQKEDLDTLVALGHQKRAEDEDFWISTLASRAAQRRSPVLIISGIRFHNEVELLRQAPCNILVRVVRTTKTGAEFISPDRDPNDTMETTQLDFVVDFELRHPDTAGPRWLEAKARALVGYLFKS